MKLLGELVVRVEYSNHVGSKHLSQVVVLDK